MKPHELEANLEQMVKDLKRPKPMLDKIGTVIVSKVKPHVRVRTGVLQGSIAYRFADNDSLFVGSAVPYAPFVDARYPFLQPGLDDAQGDIDRITQEWGDEMFRKVAE